MTNKSRKYCVFLLEAIVPERTPFAGSPILVNPELLSAVKSVLPFEAISTKLLYRLSAEGASSYKFHEKCDNLGPYLILCWVNDKYIFGAFCSVPFLKKDKYQSCSDSFIFSIQNTLGLNIKNYPIRKEKKFLALYHSTKSPCFGTTILGKHDLWIE